MYIHTYIHTYTHIHLCLCLSTFSYIYIYICIHIHIYEANLSEQICLGIPFGDHPLELERYREDQYGPCARMTRAN